MELRWCIRSDNSKSKISKEKVAKISNQYKNYINYFNIGEKVLKNLAWKLSGYSSTLKKGGIPPTKIKKVRQVWFFCTRMQ